jgi:hypothetical protein
MPLFPYDRFDIASPLPAAELCARLAHAVEPKPRGRFGRDERAFQGRVEGNWFRIWRVIGHHNSFLPTIVGTVEPTPAGSRLRGTMSLNPLVGILLAVSTLGVVIWGIQALRAPSDSRMAPLGMLLLMWILSSGSFTLESRPHTSVCARSPV